MAAPVARFKAVIPAKLRRSAFIPELVQATVRRAKLMKDDFARTTKTWKGDKPTFNTETAVEPQYNAYALQFPRRIVLRVWPRPDNSKGYRKWHWLEGGTRVRYVLMTKNFVPKTRVEQLNSWKGRGGLLLRKGRPVFVRKNPRPGIKAREWTGALKKKHEKPFAKEMRKAMERAAAASGHGGR